MNYKLERLSDNNIKDVLFLFNSVFDFKATLPYLQKKYDTSYTHAKHLTYLLYDNDTPIAFYGALAQLFNFNGKKVLGVHACDSIVMPNYQRKGIHKFLAGKAYELMKTEHVKFVYAFHSEATFYSCKKLNWEEHKNFRCFIFKTGAFPIIKIAKRVGLKNLHKNYVNKYLKKYIATSFENSNSQSLSVDYSPAFFKYKCFTNNYIIELDNVKWWIKISSGIMVGDVNFNSEEDLFKSINSLKKLGRKIGCSEITMQAYPETILEKALTKKYDSFESWVLGVKKLDIDFDISGLSPNFGDLDTF